MGAGAGAAEPLPLERCVGACMRMLRAMLRSELSSLDSAASSLLLSGESPGGVGGGVSGGGSRNGGGASGLGSDSSVYNQMPFLEEGFGDGFGLDGNGWRDGGDVLREAAGGVAEDAARAAVHGPDGGGGEGAGVGVGVAGAMAVGIDATVVCLQECQSPDLQRGLLGVLLGLREERSGSLRRELLR